MRKLGIMAYGDEDDRKRLAKLAAASKVSASIWIIMKIRECYADVYGTTEVEDDAPSPAHEADGVTHEG